MGKQLSAAAYWINNIFLTIRMLGLMPWYWAIQFINAFGGGDENIEAIAFDLPPPQAIP